MLSNEIDGGKKTRGEKQDFKTCSQTNGKKLSNYFKIF